MLLIYYILGVIVINAIDLYESREIIVLSLMTSLGTAFIWPIYLLAFIPDYWCTLKSEFWYKPIFKLNPKNKEQKGGSVGLFR